MIQDAKRLVLVFDFRSFPICLVSTVNRGPFTPWSDMRNPRPVFFNKDQGFCLVSKTVNCVATYSLPKTLGADIAKINSQQIDPAIFRKAVCDDNFYVRLDAKKY